MASGQNEPSKLRHIRLFSCFPPLGSGRPGSERRGRILGIWALYFLYVGLAIEKRYVVTFSELKDYIALDLNELSFSKKENCLILNSSKLGKYASPHLDSLLVKGLKACEHQLVIYFEPAKSESELPLRDHVKVKMKYSLDGLE